jgi:hypothetical protein
MGNDRDLPGKKNKKTKTVKIKSRVMFEICIKNSMLKKTKFRVLVQLKSALDLLF